MVLTISRKNSILFFIYLYIFVCVLFPLDVYSLKPVFFLTICILGLPDFIYAFKTGQMKNIMIMGVIYPAVMIAISCLNNGKIGSAVSGSYPATLILITIPVVIQDLKNEFEIALNRVLLIEAFLIVLLVMLDIVGIFNVNEPSAIRQFFYDMGIGVMGKSHAYSSYYKIFFKTSPLLIFLLDYAWENKRRVVVALTIMAIVFSGTRANLLIAGVYISWRLIFKTFRNRKTQLVMGALFIIVLVILSGNVISIWQAMMNTAGSVGSDQIRSGQLIGLMTELKKPSTLFWGAGIGTTFYDYGRLTYISGVELSYFDLLRQIGLILFIPFIVFVFRPLLNMSIKTGFKVSYIGYLAIAFTNPLLFTSTAYLAYTDMQIRCYKQIENDY